MIRSTLVRYVLPVAAALSIIAFVGVPYIEHMLTDWFRADIEMRARLVMNSIEEPLTDLLERGETARLAAYLEKVVSDERLLAVLICDTSGAKVYATRLVPADVTCDSPTTSLVGDSSVTRIPSGLIEVSSFTINPEAGRPYRALLVHDLSFIDRRQATARNFVLAFAVLAVGVLGLLGGLVTRYMLNRSIKVLLGDIRSRRFLDDARSPRSSRPVLASVRNLLREIEQTQRLEIEFHENWTPQALQQVVREHLGSCPLVVVSNREPYIHNRGPDGEPVVQVPASGMVTALEPIVRACSGTWVAHGSGSEDRRVVDRHDHVRVPPGDPAYSLRRVWLTSGEEDGYYYGFSNEGMWPLCHLAYVRPAFREDDWHVYRSVNEKFAAVVAAEAKSESPVILIQDFHFALLPRLVRERKPKATIALFWHIPWPNAETFGVCPWKREVLAHMLSADVLGFHTRYHCQNFLATADRYVECQIDHEHMTVTHQGHVCRVVPYPISIEWPPRWLDRQSDVPTAREAVRRRHGIGRDVRIGLGVERWDFTKGIVERFLALEKLLDEHPQWRGRMTLLQVAAPTRSRLPAYQALQQHTLSEANRINARFGSGDWQPIVLVGEHQEPAQVFELYRAADFCIVNSLHDGMNLVAKEFVSARDDEDGVLILSTLAGASRELVEALLVNPFDIGETADAMRAALEMPRDERRQRMKLMRRTVKENNVYRWAGRMLMDIARIRQRQALAESRPGDRVRNWQR
ncbi:MAG TPA: trehalose-6-phosphate synthase [Steroidobacteraceae bacterium]